MLPSQLEWEKWNGNMGIRPAMECTHRSQTDNRRTETGNRMDTWEPTHLPMIHISWDWFERCPTEPGRRHRTLPTAATAETIPTWPGTVSPPQQQRSYIEKIRNKQAILARHLAHPLSVWSTHTSSFSPRHSHPLLSPIFHFRSRWGVWDQDKGAVNFPDSVVTPLRNTT